MRRTVILLVALATAAPGFAGSPDADAIVGLWRTAPDPKDGAAIVEIVRDGETFAGRIVWLEKPLYGPDEDRPGQPKVDLRNPDPSLRERPVLGLELLSGFRFDGRKWKGGTIYDPASGTTYRCVMKLLGADRLKVRGYVGISLLGRTEVWTRVREIPRDEGAALPPRAGG